MPSKNYRWPAQKALELHLVAHDISRVDLAQRVDISPVTLSGIITGRARPSRRIRALIADALGVPAGTLFVGVEDPTSEELAEAETAEQLRRLKGATHVAAG